MENAHAWGEPAEAAEGGGTSEPALPSPAATVTRTGLRTLISSRFKLPTSRSSVALFSTAEARAMALIGSFDLRFWRYQARICLLREVLQSRTCMASTSV